MGHRANYVIQEAGEYRLFYSHWGALTVPSDLFWGPQWAEAFIGAQEEEVGKSDGWLDNVWGEGGAALDKDTATIVLFGGEDLAYALRPVFLELMQALWGQWGWTVRWAERGMPDIATQVGVDPGLVTAEPDKAFPASLDFARLDPADPNAYVSTLLIFRSQGEDWVERLGAVDASSILCAGPEVVSWREELPSLDEAADLIAADSDFRPAGIIIDEQQRRVIYFDRLYGAEQLPFIRDDWPEWTVEYVEEASIRALYAEIEQPVPEILDHALKRMEKAQPKAPQRSEVQCLEAIAAILFGESRDPSLRINEIIAEYQDRGAEIEVNPSALQPVQGVQPDDAQRRRLFSEALRLRMNLKVSATE